MDREYISMADVEYLHAVVFSTDDAFREGGGTEVLELPPVELSTLPLIAKVCTN